MNLIQSFKIFIRLPARERKRFFSLLKIYHKLEKETKQFQAETGLHCIAGCGRCCENPRIETTVAELMPLAFRLFQRGEESGWLDKANRSESKGQCIFYKPDPLIEGKGRCSVYQWRPLICRLFGFSAITDKKGRPSLVTCAVIKQSQMQTYLK